MTRAVLGLLVLLPVLAWGQGAPRTPNLRLKYSGDAVVNDNFVKVDDCFGTTLDRCITRLRLGGQRSTDGVLTVFNDSTSIHSLGVWSDNGTGGTLQRFIVENTAGSKVDVDFRNATVNFGADTTLTEPTGGTSAFFFSPTGTADYDAIRFYKPGQGSSGTKRVAISTAGRMTSWGGGVASTIYQLCAESDQSCTNPRFKWGEFGEMSWGSGSGAVDVTLSRSAANILALGSGDALSGMVLGATPTAQTIAAGNTVAADACGGIKSISSAGSVTTDTTNTFTAPAATNTGCVMTVCNTGANPIALDKNALFVMDTTDEGGDGDLDLTTDDCVLVGSDGSKWRQLARMAVN